MNVLVVNASPHGDKGNTGWILNPFIEGMKNEGAEVTVLYTRKMNIKPCLGCLACWLKTPGECVLKDDYDPVLPMIKAADIIVFATPLYWDGVSGPMKMFLDRMTPMGLPFLEMRDGRDRHPVREGYGHGKVVVVSTCGYFSTENFDAMLDHCKAITINMEREFAGALLRPNAQSLQPMIMMGMEDQLTDILEASRKAGEELIGTGEMKAETLAVVSRDIMPVEVFLDNANSYFTKLYKKLEEKQNSA